MQREINYFSNLFCLKKTLRLRVFAVQFIMATTALFFLFAGLAIACAVSLVYHKNPLYSAVSLVGVLISLACIYITLAAPFIAAVQILIYAARLWFWSFSS